MRFGTPLSPSALKVVLLGGGELGKEVVIELQRLGVPESELRLFGKPESFAKRRMSVAVARGSDVSKARARAKQAASRVRVVKGENA